MIGQKPFSDVFDHYANTTFYTRHHYAESAQVFTFYIIIIARARSPIPVFLKTIIAPSQQENGEYTKLLRKQTSMPRPRMHFVAHELAFLLFAPEFRQ